jgi:hypothetical protein
MILNFIFGLYPLLDYIIGIKKNISGMHVFLLVIHELVLLLTLIRLSSRWSTLPLMLHPLLEFDWWRLATHWFLRVSFWINLSAYIVIFWNLRINIVGCFIFNWIIAFITLLNLFDLIEGHSSIWLLLRLRIWIVESWNLNFLRLNFLRLYVLYLFDSLVFHI